VKPGDVFLNDGQDSARVGRTPPAASGPAGSAPGRNGPQGGGAAFSIGGIPPENSHPSALTELRKSWMDNKDRAKDRVLVQVYPAGLEITTGKDPVNPPPEDAKRGQIFEFSPESKRRLKEVFMTLWMPKGVQRAVTVGSRRVLDRAAFQACMDRFTARCVYYGWAGQRRNEMQARKSMHAHLNLWTPAGVTDEQIRDVWLECTGERRDKDSLKYAVKCRVIQQDEAGWIIYMAKHDGKSGQEVTEGKHWGHINRKALVERVPSSYELSAGQHAILLRWIRRHQQAARRRDVALLLEKFLAVASEQCAFAMSDAGAHVSVDSCGRFYLWGGSGESKGELPSNFCAGLKDRKAWQSLRGNRVPPMHRGDLLRMLPGPVLVRMICAIQSGECLAQNVGDPF